MLLVVFWTLSTIGNVLGLTPTYSEAFDSPERWVDRHYRAFRLRVRSRIIRAMSPAPYEGACTRHVRYRVVRWSGSRFHSHVTKCSRLRNAGC